MSGSQPKDIILLKMTSGTTVSGSVPTAHCCWWLSLKIYYLYSSPRHWFEFKWQNHSFKTVIEHIWGEKKVNFFSIFESEMGKVPFGQTWHLFLKYDNQDNNSTQLVSATKATHFHIA